MRGRIHVTGASREKIFMTSPRRRKTHINYVNIVKIFDLPVLSKRCLLKLDSFHPEIEK